MVFESHEKRKKLNGITHWRIFREMLNQIFHHKVRQGNKKVVLDAPLLFETNILEHICHPIITVFIGDEQMQIERLLARNPQLSPTEAKQRIDS